MNKKIFLILILAAIIIIVTIMAGSKSHNNQPVHIVELMIQEHKFTPENIHVPRNTKLKLIVKNMDDEAEEFESDDLKREKIIPAHGYINVNIGPLSPGEYKFYGDFHQDTANGSLIVE